MFKKKQKSSWFILLFIIFSLSLYVFSMLPLIEPQWWILISKSLFAWMHYSVFWSYRIPILADVFVFTYPVYLLALYIYGWVKKNIYHKIAALYIWAGVVFSIIVSIGIQFCVDKVRPNIVLWFSDFKKETLLHSFLPSSSFPSDHATVTMSIAMMSLFRGIKNKDKKFLRFGGILIVFSLITSFARVSSGVHWPTDIIAGISIGIVIPLLLMWKPIYNFGTWIAEKIGKII